MQLRPRYGDPSFLQVDLPAADPAEAMLRQRRRLAMFLDGLDDEQWAAPSRCELWSVQDVIAHLVSTNQFWVLSIEGARRGEPTQLLATLDPVATPEELVDGVRSLPWSKVLKRFVESNEAMADALRGLDDDGWSAIGEAPPGHVPLRALVLHALWDSWIHERDVMLPLGVAPAEEPDEIDGSLRYAAALSPLFAVGNGSERRGTIVVEATDPAIRFVVDVGKGVHVHDGDAPAGALELTGPAVELLEGISFRGPLPCTVGDEHRWMFDGIARAFDRE